MSRRHEALAALLGYPREGYAREVERSREELVREEPALAAFLDPFAASVRASTLEELEELFTNTFDLNPVCALEVGWQLYGENYERGRFLAEMQEGLKRAGLPESPELPDHLTRVLPLLSTMPAGEAAELARRFVLPAVEKMLKGFEGAENPFGNVLKAVGLVLRRCTEAVPAGEEVAHG